MYGVTFRKEEAGMHILYRFYNTLFPDHALSEDGSRSYNKESVHTPFVTLELDGKRKKFLKLEQIATIHLSVSDPEYCGFHSPILYRLNVPYVDGIEKRRKFRNAKLGGFVRGLYRHMDYPIVIADVQSRSSRKINFRNSLAINLFTIGNLKKLRNPDLKSLIESAEKYWALSLNKPE